MRVEYTSAVPDDVPERLAAEVDDVGEPRTFAPLDAAAARELAERYLEHFLKSTGTRAERLEDDAEIEVWDEVGDRAREETDPLPLLDALVTMLGTSGGAGRRERRRASKRQGHRGRGRDR